jgi:hypothetical protein
VSSIVSFPSQPSVGSPSAISSTNGPSLAKRVKNGFMVPSTRRPANSTSWSASSTASPSSRTLPTSSGPRCVPSSPPSFASNITP